MTSIPFLTSTQIDAFKAAQNFGIFFKLDMPTTSDGDMTLRLWSGVGDYPVKTAGGVFTGFQSIDSNGDVYYGAGLLEDIPEVEVLVNGLAERVQFVMSGIPNYIAREVADSAPVVKGREVRVGMAPLDADYQPIISPVSLWFGVADYWSIQMDVAQGKEPAIFSIALSVGSGMTGRSRPRLVSFTNAQQLLAHPTDRFFDRVLRYTVSYTVAWPKF